MKILKHFGVYGVCIKDGKLLCIEKTRGPYRNRFDLPGGSQEEQEGLLDTLKREVREETGRIVSKVYDNNIFDLFVKIDDNSKVHHIFAMYKIDVVEQDSQKVLEYVSEEELNDSRGATWIDLSEFNEHNASPLILKVIEEKVNFDVKHYDDWKIY